MPRVLFPEEPRGPAQIIDLPRPRQVQPATVALDEFGASMSQLGQRAVEHIVQQQRSAARTKLTTLAVERLGELENEIDNAGTVGEGRALLRERMPQLLKEFERAAKNEGLPEFVGNMKLLAQRSQISTKASLGKRAASEGVDDFRRLLSAYEDRMAGARTTGDFVGLRAELSTAAEQVAQTNPLITPPEAERLYRETLNKAAVRRATSIIQGSVGNVGALQAAKSSVLDERAHPDLPLDARAKLALLADQLAEQAVDRNWQQHRRQEMLEKETREKLQTNTAQAFMQRLAQREEVTDQELLFASANGDLHPSMINAIQGWRDGLVENEPDFTAYMEDSIKSELGILDPAVAADRLRSGAYPPEKAFSLINDNAAAWRQGGLRRLDRVKEAERTILNMVLGVVGDDYNSLIRAMDEASDAERRLASNLLLQFGRQLDAAQTQMEAGELDPRAFDPFPLAAEILERGFSEQARPTIAAIPGPFAVERYSNFGVRDLELALEDMHEALATGDLSRTEAGQLNDQIFAVQKQIDKLRQYESNLQTIELLGRGRERR